MYIFKNNHKRLTRLKSGIHNKRQLKIRDLLIKQNRVIQPVSYYKYFRKSKAWSSAFGLFSWCNHKNLIPLGADFFALKWHIYNSMRWMYFSQQCATLMDSPASV